MSIKKYDTIVVGGGIAGLAAAAFLVKEGKEVLLIEKNEQCGGLVNSFQRDGFQFDAGVRALLDAGIIMPMLNELEIELEVVKSSVSVGIGKDIMHVDGIASLQDYRDLLVKTYPDSEEEVEEILRVIRKIMKNMDVLYGVENPIVKDFMKDKKAVFTKLLPWLPKFLFTISKINSMGMPVEEYLDTFVENRSLRDIISQHFFKHTPTFFALSYFSLYLDYFYPKGGVGSLAKVLESKALDLGCEIKYNTIVTDVQAASKRLVDSENTTYTYNNLIWAADLKTLYRISKIDGFSDKIQRRIEKEKERKLCERGGDSVYTLFVEVDAPLAYFKEIANGHFFYTPSSRGLGEIHRSELQSMLDNWEQVSKEQLHNWIERYLSLNTYEISIPGLKDASLVPEGKTGLMISFLSEYDLFKKLKESGKYKEIVSEIESGVLAVLASSVFPVLGEKVISSFSFTPLDIESRVGSSEGAITGWSFEGNVPVIKKMQQSGRSVLTPIPSVYQAGQWTYSPAGVPMSILTGKLASDKVLKRGKR